MRTPRFISLEGIEGVGKTTNLQFILHYLQQRQIPVIVTREPGGSIIAEKIRDLLLAHQNEALCADAELLLLFAARAQHVQQTILPALQQGKWVLSDRFIDASYAYQGAGRNTDRQRISWLEQMVLGNLTPDLTLILDAPVEIAIQRIQLRGPTDRFETEDASFFQRVRQEYLQRALQNPQRYRKIDAALSLDQVQSQLEAVLNSFIENTIQP